MKIAAALVAALVTTLAPAAVLAENYPLNHPADTPTGTTHDRWVNTVTLATDSTSLTISVGQGADKVLYHDCLAKGCFAAYPGQSVTPSVGYSKDWMHAYLYIDYDNDGKFAAPDPGNPSAGAGELVSFSYLDGLNSAGDSITDQNTMAMPPFTIPASTRPGVYRARFVVDWDSALPGGSPDIAANGGAIIDIPVYVATEGAAPAITYSADAADLRILGYDKKAPATTWPALQCIPLNIITRPDCHIGSVTVTAALAADPVAEALGNPTSWTTEISPDAFFIGNGVIPGHCVLPMDVEVKATAAPGAVKMPYADQGYHLVWNDEFNTPDGTHPSPELYETPERYGAAWNRFISSRPDLMVMRDGNLMMYCKPNPEEDRTPQDDREMVSGAIRTMNHFSFRHGRIEARMKVHGYTGSFPAFWLMPNTQPQGWPVSGEIDIFESINDADRAYATLHTGKWANNDVNTAVYNTGCTINDWHVYAIEWDEDSFKGYIDGELKGTVTTSNIREGLWPFNEQEFYIILNQSVGNGSWAASPDVNHTYLTEVDWVRVYQRDGQTATGAMEYPSDPWTGIESVAAGAADGPEELFTLQGVRIERRNAAPGIYISRHGNGPGRVVTVL